MRNQHGSMIDLYPVFRNIFGNNSSRSVDENYFFNRFKQYIRLYLTINKKSINDLTRYYFNRNIIIKYGIIVKNRIRQGKKMDLDIKIGVLDFILDPDNINITDEEMVKKYENETSE